MGQTKRETIAEELEIMFNCTSCGNCASEDSGCRCAGCGHTIGWGVSHDYARLAANRILHALEGPI